MSNTYKITVTNLNKASSVNKLTTQYVAKGIIDAIKCISKIQGAFKDVYNTHGDLTFDYSTKIQAELFSYSLDHTIICYLDNNKIALIKLTK